MTLKVPSPNGLNAVAGLLLANAAVKCGAVGDRAPSLKAAVLA